jgi:hypothetical protein
MHIVGRQDRAAAADHETIGLRRRVRTLAVQQTPVMDYRTLRLVQVLTCASHGWSRAELPVQCGAGRPIPDGLGKHGGHLGGPLEQV